MRGRAVEDLRMSKCLDCQSVSEYREMRPRLGHGNSFTRAPGVLRDTALLKDQVPWKTALEMRI